MRAQGAVFLVLYYAVGVLFYSHRYDWGILDSAYFATVTLASVGYGDFYPLDVQGQLFTIVYILLGLSFVMTDLGEFILSWWKLLQAAIESFVFSKVPASTLMGSSMSILYVLLTCALGAVCMCLLEGWDWTTGMYWSVVTSTTVGFGDLKVEHNTSKVFAIFFILCSTAVVACELNRIASFQQEASSATKREALLERPPDARTVQSVPAELRKHFGLSRESLRKDKCAFLCMSLTHVGALHWMDLRPWLHRFDELDTCGDGVLDLQDVLDAEGKLQEQRKTAKIPANIIADEISGLFDAFFSWERGGAKLAVVALFYSAGIGFYQARYHWSTLDCAYFSTVTIWTVGYGDYTPSDDIGKIFTVLFILGGLFFVASTINDIIGSALKYTEATALDWMERGTLGRAAPRSVCLALFTISAFAIPLIGAVVVQSFESLPFFESYYWAFVTATTVGYGDITVKQQLSRAFCLLYVPVSCAAMTGAISRLSCWQAELAMATKRNDLRERRLDATWLKQMAACAGSSSMDRVEKWEFVYSCLTQLELVSQHDLNLWLTRFERLQAETEALENVN